MKVMVNNLYTDKDVVVEGATARELVHKLHNMFPYLESGHLEHTEDLERILELINAQQALEAEIVPESVADADIGPGDGPVEDVDIPPEEVLRAWSK